MPLPDLTWNSANWFLPDVDCRRSSNCRDLAAGVRQVRQARHHFQIVVELVVLADLDERRVDQHLRPSFVQRLDQLADPVLVLPAGVDDQGERVLVRHDHDLFLLLRLADHLLDLGLFVLDGLLEELPEDLRQVLGVLVLQEVDLVGDRLLAGDRVDVLDHPGDRHVLDLRGVDQQGVA